MLTFNESLEGCKVVFTTALFDIEVDDKSALFNAPRPLLGKANPCTNWCYGRFYSEVDLASEFAASFIKQNNDLDARLVVRITEKQAVELALVNNKYADRYRELPFAEQLELLSPRLSKLQHLPYLDAVALLNIIQATAIEEAA